MKSIKGIKHNVEDIKQYLLDGTEAGIFDWIVKDGTLSSILDHKQEVFGTAYVSSKSIFVSKKKIIYSEGIDNKIKTTIMPSDETLYNKIMDYAKYGQCSYEDSKNIRDYLLTELINNGVYSKK